VAPKHLGRGDDTGHMANQSYVREMKQSFLTGGTGKDSLENDPSKTMFGTQPEREATINRTSL
jgi:hypothetical protein